MSKLEDALDALSTKKSFVYNNSLGEFFFFLAKQTHPGLHGECELMRKSDFDRLRAVTDRAIEQRNAFAYGNFLNVVQEDEELLAIAEGKG